MRESSWNSVRRRSAGALACSRFFLDCGTNRSIERLQARRLRYMVEHPAESHNEEQ
jgi:hypothetical protein